MANPKPEPTFTEACEVVWKKLSAINVNDHVEKKNGLSYLSWAWAYQTIMEHYPNFDYKFDEDVTHPDGTVTVHCKVWVIEVDHVVLKSMWLPVMNYANKAINNPSSVDRNYAYMRCLTKGISMLGLGAYIYAGEDLPQEPKGDTPDKPAPSGTNAVTKKKVAKKVAAKPAPAEAPPDDDPFNESGEIAIEDDDGAADVADKIIAIAVEMHSGSVSALADFWKKNTKVINFLKDGYNEEFLRVKASFTALRKAAQE